MLIPVMAFIPPLLNNKLGQEYKCGHMKTAFLKSNRKLFLQVKLINSLVN